MNSSPQPLNVSNATRTSVATESQKAESPERRKQSPDSGFQPADIMQFQLCLTSQNPQPLSDMGKEEPILPSGTSVPLPPAIQQLQQHILHQIPAFPDQFECSLLLPQLGEVQLSATQTNRQWSIQIGFMQPAALATAQASRNTLSRKLSDKLGQPVHLTLSLTRNRHDDE